VSRSFLVPIVFPQGDTFQPGLLKLFGASPFGGNLTLYQDAARTLEIFNFGAAVLIAAEVAGQPLRLESRAEVSFWPGATATPATAMRAKIDANRLITYQAAGGFTDPIRLVSEAASVYTFLSFYDSTETTRQAFVGSRSGHMYVGSDAGQLCLFAASAQPLIFAQSGTYPPSAASEIARFESTNYNFLVGKQVAAIANPGVAITNRNFGSNPSVQVSTDAAGGPNFVANHIGAADANAQDFCSFRRNNTVIGTIDQNSTTGVRYNVTSDYRLKNDLGPLVDGLARVERLRPIQVTWKDDPDEQVMDAFMAHEVAEVVPEAVSGAKDAVDDDGEIAPQQLDVSKLVPALVAAVQELSAKVKSLEAELATLKGAA